MKNIKVLSIGLYKYIILKKDEGLLAIESHGLIDEIKLLERDVFEYGIKLFAELWDKFRYPWLNPYKRWPWR
jgi:hypothetical protein